MIRFLKKEWYILLPILSAFVFGILVYPQLPEKIPTHWNIQGEVDGWSGKLFGVYFLALLNLAFYPLMIVLPQIDPRRRNYANFAWPYKIMRLILHYFLAIIYVVSLLVALGFPIRVDFIVRLGVSVLFIVIGNYMGKLKHNYFVGIKTPWTLASEEVWFKTHRFSGPIWVGAGLLGIVLSFFRQPWSGYISFASYIIIALVPIAYSYLIFRKLNQDK